MCFALQKSWDQEGAVYLKKELDLGDLGDFLTALATLKHQEFGLLPLKIKKTSYRLWRCRKAASQFWNRGLDQAGLASLWHLDMKINLIYEVWLQIFKGDLLKVWSHLCFI